MALSMKPCARHKRAFQKKHPAYKNEDPQRVGIAWDPWCFDCNRIGAPARIDLRVFGIRFLRARDGSRFVVGDGQLVLF